MIDRTALLGPVAYTAVEFPDGVVDPAGLDTLLRLVDAGVVRVLDLEFVARADDGSARHVPAHDVAHGAGPDLGRFDGADSGLLDREDLDDVASRLHPGAVAAVLVHEELAGQQVLSAWLDGGATLLADGPVSAEDLVEALDDTDDAGPDTGSRG